MRRLTFLATLSLCVAAGPIAQAFMLHPPSAQESSAEDSLVRPTGQATRTDRPPTIDGRLDDPEWAQATPLGPLTEVIPNEGAKPQDATEIRILFDENAIYFGIRCYDSDPAGLISTTKERDGFFDADDRIEMIIDTFQDRRNAFFFQINPAGSKGDALITGNGQNFNKPWDGIWKGKTTIDEKGWSAEMAIPFKTLSFRRGLGTWGYNLERYVGRRNERQRWSGASQNYGIFRIFTAGDVQGLGGMEQGIGIDVAPFLVARNLDARGSDTAEGFDQEVGLDAFFKLSTNLTASVTLNTDFAETEVDERQVNLTRFPLFFPERRDFFLQDAGLFEFANLGSDLIPFFSRKVGLASGRQVPIDAGLKLSGRAGSYTLGILDVQTGDEGALDGQNLFAAKVSRDIGKQSSVGAIVTSGNPSDTGDNTVGGLDFNYRTSELFGGKQLQASAWAIRSDSQGLSGQDGAFGASVAYPNDLWTWNLSWAEIQENFNPALGFVPRTGVRRMYAGAAYRPRPNTHIRQYSFELDGSFVTDTNDRLQSGEIEWQPLGIEWETGDELHLEITHSEERLIEDFEIRPGITIPQDDYDYLDYRVEFQSAIKRDASFEVRLTHGDFYDGDRLQFDTTLLWQPGPDLTASLGYEHNDVNLEGGDFVADLARLRVTRSFTPDLSLSNLLQWDSETDTFGLNSRLRWIPEPGQEVFLVFNHSADDLNGGPFDRVFQEVALKLVYTLRF